MIHLDYRDARPIYAQITDGIREQILSGILLSGDKLPSVREMAAELTINPNTIQRAYRELEMQGWIATVPGKGCFVCGMPASARDAQTKLLRSLDQAVEALLHSGMTRQEILTYLTQGGNDDVKT